ncbi:hypothetical protein TSACC_2755 [Terrimicrobium sacchariphilum]|uniref:Uncharacterized protein n=1 Tax=Terrimicrobium sacchariphilum TaxID=690879 RepID=A0A146G5X6_TERSA|nr:hypothetical protein [Terrimicrobium sacchariphilum]GAT32357.1 hypothetical protein TSACC_2755 [Terrimicrobium sacchariphilum]
MTPTHPSPAMKTSAQHHKLLDGTFTPAEAEHILLALVNSKIDFHSLEKLSYEERTGRDLKNSARRLRELTQLREDLRRACQSAALAGASVTLRGTISIEIETHAQVSVLS